MSSRAWLKYVEVARAHLRTAWAYLWDQLLGTLYLAVIMFVFVQLWRVTYDATGGNQFAGYRLAEIIWYLVATEAIVLSLPPIHSTIDAEVKDGDLAIRLNKPYHYLLFHYSAFLGESLMKLALKITMGGLVAYLLVGGFAFRWEALPVMLLVYLTTQLLHFFYSAVIGLSAFWTEDSSGLYLLADRLKWVLGGFLMPIELYPEAARRVVEALPFRHMLAGPARLFVKFSWAGAGELLLSQLVWLLIFGGICVGVYRLGVRRVDLNGG